MEIKKIVDMCKKSGALYITEVDGVQWIGNGQAVYPLYDLPKLTAGMFVVGIIFPEPGLRADVATEIKEIAEMMW